MIFRNKGFCSSNKLLGLQSRVHMFRKIFNFFKEKEVSEASKIDMYEQLFKEAQNFTDKNEFNLDSKNQSSCEASISQLINEISDILVKEIPKYRQYGFDPIVRFGGDCGNIHFAILGFIKQHYPSICANITVGGVLTSNKSDFKFDQNKCIEWLENGSPQVLDCHTWITINNNYILDCTIGTYINTRIDANHVQNKKDNLYGGLIFGSEDKLEHIAFKGLGEKTPLDYRNMKYSPVILGIEAFTALAPKQP
jgi:hypothetical protein